jgi:hypothetical protein
MLWCDSTSLTTKFKFFSELRSHTGLSGGGCCCTNQVKHNIHKRPNLNEDSFDALVPTF